MLAALCFLGFCVTLIMFVVYWWKKRKARLAAGENYQDDEHYQYVSSRKRLIGWICFLLFMGTIVSPKISESLMTPEEKIAYQEEKAQRESESKRRAEEKAAQEEAEAKRLAEEKAAQEAEAKRLAEEKAAQESEAKRLAEEKAQQEAEAKRLAEEKAQQEAEQKRLAEEKRTTERGQYVGTYNSGMKAYIVPETLRVSEDRDSCKVRIAAENDAGEISYLDYSIWLEGNSLRFSNSEGYSGSVTPNMTVENKIWEVAQNVERRAATENARAKDEDSGIWDSAKSFVKDKLNDAKDFAGGVVSNEVYVCDKGLFGTYYIIPSTKKRRDIGIVFKDEGYEIEVICKEKNGAVRRSDIYLFCERSDGTWEYKREQDNSWQRIKHTYSELEEEWGGDLGKLIYDASNHFPNL